MGGNGSGSYYRFNSKGKTEESLPIDIRELYKKKLLFAGRSITSKWSRGGNVYASIGGIVFDDHLLNVINLRRNINIYLNFQYIMV